MSDTVKRRPRELRAELRRAGHRPYDCRRDGEHPWVCGVCLECGNEFRIFDDEPLPRFWSCWLYMRPGLEYRRCSA